MNSNNSMFIRNLAKSILNRKSRMFVAVLAISMGATVVATMLSLISDITSKMNRELRAYGANLAVIPNDNTNQLITEEELYKIKSLIPENSIIGIQPILYVVGEFQDKQFAVAGLDYSQIPKVTPYWLIDGYKMDDISLPSDSNSAIIGSTLARQLQLKRGENYSLFLQTDSGPVEYNITVSGILSTGGQEENQIFIPLSTLHEKTKHSGQISVIQASILGTKESIDNIADEINTSIPTVQANPILKIAKAEGIVLDKIQYIMLLISITILIISALTVMTTMTALVVERQGEIALIKAIGAADNEVFRFFFIELLILGLAGGIIGFLAGFGLAQILGKGIFHTYISLRWLVIPTTLMISCAISIIAGLWTIRKIMEIEPAVVLRGE